MGAGSLQSAPACAEERSIVLPQVWRKNSTLHRRAPRKSSVILCGHGVRCTAPACAEETFVYDYMNRHFDRHEELPLGKLPKVSHSIPMLAGSALYEMSKEGR